MQLASDLKTSECTEFGPLTIKESDVLAQNVFFLQKWIIIQLWNLYHCEHHTWKPHECSEFGSSKYKEKWCFSPKCVVFRNRSSYSLETCTNAIGMAENLRVHWVWPSNYKGKWCFSPKCVVFQKWVIIQLWNLYHCNHHTWKPQSALSLVL